MYTHCCLEMMQNFYSVFRSSVLVNLNAHTPAMWGDTKQGEFKAYFWRTKKVHKCLQVIYSGRHPLTTRSHLRTHSKSNSSVWNCKYLFIKWYSKQNILNHKTLFLLMHVKLAPRIKAQINLDVRNPRIAHVSVIFSLVLY